jgi:hypothetical protein
MRATQYSVRKEGFVIMSIKTQVGAAALLVCVASCTSVWQTTDPETGKNAVQLPNFWPGGCAVEPNADGTCTSYQFRWPLVPTGEPDRPDKIAAGYGPRWHDSGARYDFHPGLDLLPLRSDGTVMSQAEIAASAPPVHAVAAGEVHSIKEEKNLGHTVRIRHKIDDSGDWTASNTYYTVYGHMTDSCTAPPDCSNESATKQCVCSSAAYELSIGDALEPGDVIGHVGRSGSASTWHLHFEVQGHPWLFYSVNPLRYLMHNEANDYRPQILTSLSGSCASTFSLSTPKFWVYYRTNPDELDVNRVTIAVTDETTKKLLALEWIDYERRDGIGAFLDVFPVDPQGNPAPDGFITQRAADGEVCEAAKSEVEYLPDCRQSGATPVPGPKWNRFSGITPIFDDCSPGNPRNDFNHSSTEQTMEIQFDNFGSAFAGSTEIRILAEVCDIANNCTSREAICRESRCYMLAEPSKAP